MGHGLTERERLSTTGDCARDRRPCGARGEIVNAVLRIAYVDPAKCDEIVFVLVVEQFLLVLSGARVGRGRLLRDDQVRYGEHLVTLTTRHTTLTAAGTQYTSQALARERLVIA